MGSKQMLRLMDQTVRAGAMRQATFSQHFADCCVVFVYQQPVSDLYFLHPLRNSSLSSTLSSCRYARMMSVSVCFGQVHAVGGIFCQLVPVWLQLFG